MNDIKNKEDRLEVEVLLSTYNGELYLKEQLDSLLNQTYGDWIAIIRDDGSTDNTVEIVKSYCARYPEKIKFIEDKAKRLGPCRSFATLLEKSTTEYIMFCDQDDMWLPQKIEETLNAMRTLESKYKGLPLLVHTDLKVTDKDLKVIYESFWRYQHLNPEFKSLNYLLILNNVTGCTMMINSELKKKSLPIPENAMLHDWWIALVASAFGRIEYIPTPMMLYRQHGRNEAGAVGYSLKYFISRAGTLGQSIALAKRVVRQGRSFFSMYKDKLSEEDRKMAYNFSILFQRRRIKRLYTLLKYRFKGYGFLRNFGIWVLLTFINNKNIISAKKQDYEK